MSTTKDWKIMVYLAGDNNLGEAMVNAITGMKRNLTLDSNIALYAYYDANVPGYPSMLFDFTKKNGSEFAQEGDENFPSIISMGRDIKTSASSVYKFVEWCTNEDKPNATKHALILSGHGDAFQKDNFLKDGNNNGYVTLSGLSDVLDGLKTKLFDGKKLPILGLDCCVMSSLEVAFQMQPHVEHLLASQGLVPDRGWDYSGTFENINRLYAGFRKSGAPEVLEATDICKAFADSFIEANRDVSDFSARSIDISYCDLKKLSEGPEMGSGGSVKADGLIQNIDILATLLEEGLLDTSVQKKIESAILSAHWRCQTFLFDQCVDIADFASELKSAILEFGNTGLLEKITKACDLTANSVEWCTKSQSIGAEYQWSHGLSVYFPWSFFSYKLIRKQYRNLDFALDKRRSEIIPEDPKSEHWDELRKSKSKWLKFLDTYLYTTLREVRPTETDQRLIMGLSKQDVVGNDNALLMAEVAGNKVNDPYDKVNDPYDKVNDPRDRLTSSQWENFRRFKNFPWAPREWRPPTRRRNGKEKKPETEAARA